MLCFKLYSFKDPTVSSTAAASVRQIVSAAFDRVVIEDSEERGTYTFKRLTTLKMSQNSTFLANGYCQKLVEEVGEKRTSFYTTA